MQIGSSGCWRRDRGNGRLPSCHLGCSQSTHLALLLLLGVGQVGRILRQEQQQQE
jgi:hypothetical protein